MKKIALLLLLVLSLHFSVGSISAQDNRDSSGINTQRGNNDGTSGITNPAIGELGDDPEAAESGATFSLYFIMIWQALISVGALLVLVYFLWAGIEWISAGGDSSKVQKARDRITQAIVGLIVLVGTFAIISWISRIFFGESFNILNLQFNTPTTQNVNRGTRTGTGVNPGGNR